MAQTAPNERNATARFQRALREALARQVPFLIERFQRASRSLSGWLSRDDVLDAVSMVAAAALGKSPGFQVVDQVVDVYDTSGSGSDLINHEEWVRLVLQDALAKNSVRIIHFLASRDSKRSGGLDKLEWRQGICAFGYDAPHDILDSIFDELSQPAAWLSFANREPPSHARTCCRVLCLLVLV